MMKIKDLIYLLYKPKPKLYDYNIYEVNVDGLGSFLYANWLHPCSKKPNFSKWDTASLSEILKEGDMYIDIGAYEGDSCMIPGLMVGKSGLVLALEPNPFVFKVLQKNALLNTDKMNILPIMTAIGESNQDMTFEYSDKDFCNGGFHKNISMFKHGHIFKLNVIGTRLQTIFEFAYVKPFLNKLKLIKIDAEGYDLFILQSIKDIIEHYKPFLLVEIFKYTDKEYRVQMYNFLTSMGYKLYIAKEFFILRQEPVYSSQDLLKHKHFDLFCEPS